MAIRRNKETINSATFWKENPFEVDLPNSANTGFNIIALPYLEQDQDGNMILIDGYVKVQSWTIQDIPTILDDQGLLMKELNSKVYFDIPVGHKWFEELSKNTPDKDWITVQIDGVQWQSFGFAPSGLYSDQAVSALKLGGI